MEKVKKVRSRLSPEARTAEILDYTADIVAQEGVAAVSVEKIGKAAGISKSAVYSYFPSTRDLLQALYTRELKALRRRQSEAAERADTLEQMVRFVTHAYLTYIQEKGLLIYRLQSEPSVAEVGGPTDFSRNAAVSYLAEIMHKNFNLPLSIAVPAVDISFGLPDAAGRYLDANHSDLQLIEDITVAMIIASIMAVVDGYDVKFKPIR